MRAPEREREREREEGIFFEDNSNIDATLDNIQLLPVLWLVLNHLFQNFGVCVIK